MVSWGKKLFQPFGRIYSKYIDSKYGDCGQEPGDKMQSKHPFVSLKEETYLSLLVWTETREAATFRTVLSNASKAL